jgi:hypothetical protein
MSVNVGSKHPRAKFNEHDVRRIRQIVANGRSMNSVAAWVGVNHETIRAIVARRNWSHVL